MTSSDRIEKKTVLKASRSRVWRALTSAQEFGTWFGAKFDTAFEPGKPARGRITNPGHDHLTIEIAVVTMEPERLFSFRWHPYAIDPAVDYDKEPTTLVEFALAEVPEGTELTIVESGFDGIPAERRAEAFRMNDGGWTAQVKNIGAHVAT